MMSAFSCPDETLNFASDLPIEIRLENSIKYKAVKVYDNKLMTKGFAWHRVIIPHKGNLKKPQILAAIFDGVKDEEFFPVAYKEGALVDCFLVRQCQAALNKLFEQNLFIHGPFRLGIMIELYVADYKEGQVSPYIKINKALNDLYSRTETYNNEKGILKLSNFASHPEFRDVIVHLGNKGVFERICQTIYGNEVKFRNINGFLMDYNGITTLQPLRYFKGREFAVLDLRHNDLRSSYRVCADLKEIKLDDLLLTGNPLTKTKGYPSSLNSIFCNLKKLDGAPVKNLLKTYTPMDYDVDVSCDGVRIDATNKDEITRYEQINEWHAVAFCDPDAVYTKDEILQGFFAAISPTLSEVYPCYYKYFSGEHQFLVRDCFDQLKFLSDNSNFEIKIPIEKLNFELYINGDGNEDEKKFRKVSFHLRLCLGAYQKGQVEPQQAITRALAERFNHMNRLLNLEKFQSAKELANIVVNLSFDKIINFVLKLAWQIYSSKIIELRLGYNKITSVKFVKALAFMTNIKVLDISYNNIKSINDIKQLENSCIKSLVVTGNPLCTNYHFPAQYIADIKKILPDVTHLDKTDITNQGILSTQKNYLCEPNLYDFVEEFVKRYFVAFETLERLHLIDMYHPKAVLSLVCNYAGGRINPINSKRICRYSDLSRNILKMTDFTRAFTTLHIGTDEICKVFEQLPKIQFDMQSFKTDVTMSNHKITVITISGIFKDLAKVIIDADIILAFSRTFVLNSVEKNCGILKCSTEYQIINDQFTITSPTAQQAKNSFVHFTNEDSRQPEELSSTDKECYLVMFQELTKLKSIWCTRCLEDCNWNFRGAVEQFLYLCDKKEIPDMAFM